MPRVARVTCVAAVAAWLAVPAELSPPLDADVVAPASTRSAQAWPDEPPGLREIGDQPFDAFEGGGWHMIWNDSGFTRLAQDPSAPLSPPGVARITYPVGFPGGIAPGTEYLALPHPHALFVGLWWKASDPWQGHESNVNKIQFVFFPDGSDIYLAMYGAPGGPYELRVLPQLHGTEPTWLTPNVGATPVRLGTWHRIEWLLVLNTASGWPDGTCRWWLDGHLVGDYTNLVFPGPFDTYKLSPTWGGVNDVKRENDYFEVDQVHISGR